jgi:L-alanine-DL-glutamate epimerase-like enolase superfamily enzyme
MMHNPESITFSTYQISLKSRFQTALRSIDNFDVYQLKIVLPSGEELLSEVVATPAITGVSAEVLVRDVHEILIPILKESSLENTEDLYNNLSLNLPNNPTARALGDLALTSRNKSSQTITIKTDVTVPICNVEDMGLLLSERISEGFTAFKIKLSDDSLANNLEKIKILNQLTPQDSILRVDPNQSWSVDYSITFLEALESLSIGLEYLEQQIHKDDVKGLALIRQNSSTAIMADEACFNLDDLNGIIEMEAADWVNIKILKSGGVTPAREMAAVALNNGLHLSIGCMIESPLGVRAAMQLAHEFAPDETHDLDAAWWYLQEKLKYEGGAVR